MKNKKNMHGKLDIVLFLLVFLISFCCMGSYYYYLFLTALANPYAGLLFFLAIAFIAFVSLVPACLIYYSLIKRRFIEFSLLFFGGFTGLVLVYSIESFPHNALMYSPIMSLYMALHNYLFNVYKINIYYLDYGGFGFVVAGLSAAVFALLSIVGYMLIKKLRTKKR
jgi:hypothetical protein